MKNGSLYKKETCPSCNEQKWEWLIWCASCDNIVCSSCVEQIRHKNGLPFNIPGRGKRYYANEK